jgi:hypothetical protein
VEGENFGFPGSDGAGKPRQLRHSDAVRPAVEALQRGPGVGQVAGGIDRAQQLLALPGGRHLAGRIPDGQPGPQPHSSPAGELLLGGQQQLADAVQRIALAAPVAQGRLLHAAADLVDHQVGQPDGVEVVHHHPGMAQRGDQRARIAAPWIQRDRGDLGQPVAGTAAEPAVHRGPGAVGHHIQQPATLEIDQASDVPSRRQAGGLEEAGLVQAERGDTVQAIGILHQRPAEIGHRPHHGRPANPEVTRHRRDRVGVLADPPTGLGAGPLGQDRPRTDRGDLLGPGPHPTCRLGAAPDPLAPAQHHRPAASGQVAYPDRAAAVGFGSHPTALTADHSGRGLNDELPLTTDDLCGEDLEAVKAQQPGG